MTLLPLLSLLHQSPDFDSLVDRLSEPQAPVGALVPEAGAAFVLAGLWVSQRRPVVVVTPSPESARRLTDQLTMWCGDEAPVFQFPEIDTLPLERLAPDILAVHQRLRALEALSALSEATPPIVVASVAAVSRSVLSKSAFVERTHTIRRGDEIALDDLVTRWVAMGYELKPSVEAPGMASRRGGILDVYPPSEDAPVRIELFGDEVDSIRYFDPDTQRSIEETESVTIIPAGDTLPALANSDRFRDLIGKLDLTGRRFKAETRLLEELSRIERGEHIEGFQYYAGFLNDSTLLDYIDEFSLLVALRPSEIEENARSLDDRLRHLGESKAERGEIPSNFPQPHVEWGRLSEVIRRHRPTLTLSPWGAADAMPGGAPRLPIFPPPTYGGAAERVWAEVSDSIDRGARTVLVTQHGERLAEMAREQGFAASGPERLTAIPEPGTVAVVPGVLRSGLLWSAGAGEPDLVILTDSELFGITKERLQPHRRKTRRAARLQDLKPGAYLVHIEHGIGKFVGTTTMENGTKREYLVLEYADDDKLYVPLEQLDRLSPYFGSSDATPRLTRLGTQEWARAKSRARRATEQLAGELLALYAARSTADGLAAEKDTPWQDQLEAGFPYEETPDQQAAILDVKKDLESHEPMDRLVCGDVGYGKTEVAIRAAFKVIQSGRQVAVLVPTTVLAQQHFETFTERLSGFPVKVGALSRIVHEDEQARVLRGLANGDIDIVIGTHRLLQRDVNFKNLGLLIIDEEHRFGVSHKERLKRMRREIDVLAMSATPIPRTLHISLAGIRDMSNIETPPEDRLPIKTYVTEENRELIREAILRELDRGGQVFFLHNRVKTINLTATELEQLVPEARFLIGHGQMPEGELETVMTRFAHHQADVLVCSTIIESGLDMPNVNTLIVDRADRLGLAQLYQLRGRIGRGSRRAYAYFLLPRGKKLTENAEQRLNTILAATELGAGYQIAMRDLEIRGAGNILGAEQSGQIAAVGFDLYMRLLQHAVEQIKAGREAGTVRPDEKEDFSLVNVDLGLDARIPYTYIEDLAERLTIYQRISRISDLKEVDDMSDELRDRFGPMPKQADLLLFTIRVRVLAEQTGITGVTSGPDRVTLSLAQPTGGARQPLQRILGRGVNVGHMQIRIDIDREDDDWQDDLLWVLRQLVAFQKRMLAALQQKEPVASPAD